MRSQKRVTTRSPSSKQYLLMIIEDIDSYLKENKFRLRNEVGVISDFYKINNQDYIVHCRSPRGKSILIGLISPSPTKTRPKRWPATGRSGARRSTLCDENADEGMIFKGAVTLANIFLLGGSPALCPNGGEIGHIFDAILYKRSSFPGIPFGMPYFRLFCFQLSKSMPFLMEKDNFHSSGLNLCNEAY